MLIGVLATLFLFSCLYAVLLTWLEKDFHFVSDYTWLCMVIGVGYTVGALALIDLEAAALVILMFVASGAPVIIRSLVLDMLRRKALRTHLTRTGNDDDRTP